MPKPAERNDVLVILAQRGEILSEQNLVEEMKIGGNRVRSFLSRLKDQGYVEGSAKDGWGITSTGREAIGLPGNPQGNPPPPPPPGGTDQTKTPPANPPPSGTVTPITPQDAAADIESLLHRYAFLAGAETKNPNAVQGSIEIIISGDPYDLDWVKQAFAQMNIDLASRNKWVNLWANYLKTNLAGLSPEHKEKVATYLKEEGPETEGGVDVKIDGKSDKGGRDWLIEDGELVRIGGGIGDYTLAEAKEVLALSLMKSRILARQAERAGAKAGGKGGGWDVDLKTGVISKDLENGEYTLSEARIRSQSIQNTLPANTGVDQKPREWYVDDQTGIIHRDPENGDCTLSEARIRSASIQRTLPPPDNGKRQTVYVDEEGRQILVPPGEQPPPRKSRAIKTILVRPDGTEQEIDESKRVIYITQPPSDDKIPITLTDDHGNPIAGIKVPYKTYKEDQQTEREEHRKDEKHKGVMNVIKEVRNQLPAIARAAERALQSRGGVGGPATDIVELACDQCGHLAKVQSGQPEFDCEECHTKNAVSWGK